MIAYRYQLISVTGWTSFTSDQKTWRQHWHLRNQKIRFRAIGAPREGNGTSVGIRSFAFPLLRHTISRLLSTNRLDFICGLL